MNGLLSLLGVIAIVIGVLGLLDVVALSVVLSAVLILVGLVCIAVERGGVLRR